eukprot:CCRYP_013627-RA/>CCRYP_013627-RA protein AED:0.12 eAED:0.95 QI:0/0/0/1/0/0/2/0/106
MFISDVAASGRSNTNSSKPNDASSPAPMTDSPLALATPAANPPSVAKCVITMPPTLPIMTRWDTRRWCRYRYPLDTLENLSWSTVTCLMRMGCDRINENNAFYSSS